MRVVLLELLQQVPVICVHVEKYLCCSCKIDKSELQHEIVHDLLFLQLMVHSKLSDCSNMSNCLSLFGLSFKIPGHCYSFSADVMVIGNNDSPVSFYSWTCPWQQFCECLFVNVFSSTLYGWKSQNTSCSSKIYSSSSSIKVMSNTDIGELHPLVSYISSQTGYSVHTAMICSQGSTIMRNFL